MSRKHILERNFSRHAGRYDAHTAAQQTIAAGLLARLEPGPFASILDIGCGTGHYTRLLHEKHPAARITAIDLSPAMIEKARENLPADAVEFHVADAETAEFETSFDLITSNACFHWFADLDRTIARCAAALTENGLLAFSTLGPRTYRELGACLDAVLGPGTPISARSFPNQVELESILRRHFPIASVDVELMVEEYPSLRHLLNTIKYAGTRGRGLEGVTMTKTLLHDLEDTYRAHVGSIAATYEVFYCLARKREV